MQLLITQQHRFLMRLYLLASKDLKQTEAIVKKRCWAWPLPKVK